LKVAQSFEKDFSFAISNKDEFQYELNEYGIEFTGSDKPVVTAKNAQGQKFKMEEEFS
jgi:protein disulfide isomerase family A protein 3